MDWLTCDFTRTNNNRFMIKPNTAFFIFAACFITAALGMFCIPLMEIDAAQYASISREMLHNKSLLVIYDLGQDYLDKPPMLFWLSALSMKIFGVHDWAYRLPSFGFACLAVYSTYRLAKLFYNRDIALLSAIVLASSQAIFLITHDVRTDTMLMGWVALSLWQMASWYKTNSRSNLIAAAVAIAGGMMTKGPIALIILVFAFAPHFILRREWKQLFRWEYLLMLLIIAILLVPMSIGLYNQFDLHPEKVMYGKDHTSGLRFFYWTQSFGRITGESTWHENAHFTFLYENMLWSFLPWIICFSIGLVNEIVSIIKLRFRINNTMEWITTGGFIFTYCALARSQAQLPHYIFIAFPLAAVITARFLYRLLFTVDWLRFRKPLLYVHAAIFSLLWLALIALMIFPFEVSIFIKILAVLCFALFLFALWYKRIYLSKLVAIALFTIIGINFFLNTNFYPKLLQYQAGSTAARIINEHNIPKENTYLFRINPGHTLPFYADHIFVDKEATAINSGDYIITNDEGLSELNKTRSWSAEYQGNDFHVSTLSLSFLNPATRSKELKPFYIIHIK
jgi:4-amino-4-deoxy-L-arabinose transferase-like glycosyltransferase